MTRLTVTHADYDQATRPEGQDYTGFGAHQSFPPPYVGPATQAPSSLPTQSSALSMVSAAQPYTTHDPSYYGQQYAQHPAYVSAPPRQVPEITSYSPTQGRQGTKVTVYFRSIYDLDAPRVSVFLMFGAKRCESVLNKTPQQGSMYSYALSAEAPAGSLTNSPSPVPLQLILDDESLVWESPSLDFGTFTYLDIPSYYSLSSPQPTNRKRKLSPEASPRQSPVKRSSMQQQAGPARMSTQAYLPAPLPVMDPPPHYRRPSLPDVYAHTRRFSGPEYQHPYTAPLPVATTSQYYGNLPTQNSALPHPAHSQQWSYHPAVPMITRSPSTGAGAAKQAALLPTPSGSNPPLIRTSTLQQSPTTTASTLATPATPAFNPYAMYSQNTKALLKIEGDLTTMPLDWSAAEWDAGRRLVQFRRSQVGSVITATFEPVTLEDRIPNSTCVSCIWWEQQGDCYVTSVDTIALLESLVAVRFTVEEKNRIRRNLEGFHPDTVSKTKPESEDFFKLIMGFPNPKPRNIEKDVKVFKWRVLAVALKKIIGKYASHPSLHAC